MDFDSFATQAWADHADAPAAVAERLAEQALALTTAPAQVARLAALSHHVYGDHLARWQEGRSLLNHLAALPACEPGSDAAAAVHRARASLALAAGGPGCEAERAVLATSEQIRVTAMAAGALAAHDTLRASRLLQDALQQADQAQLADTDPAQRTLAATCNGMAGQLEEQASRTAAERELMILAAQTARARWALAGTWLEVERAEYRLAHTWRVAGDTERARQHALACLQIVTDHGKLPLEAFFGLEALCLAERAATDTDAPARALQAAQQAHRVFADLSLDDQSWCRPTLDKLVPG